VTGGFPTYPDQLSLTGVVSDRLETSMPGIKITKDGKCLCFSRLFTNSNLLLVGNLLINQQQDALDTLP